MGTGSFLKYQKTASLRGRKALKVCRSAAGHRQVMRAFAESLAAVGRDDDRVAPGAERFAVGGNRRGLADKGHVFLQRDGELARALGMSRDDGAVVAGAAAVHI